MQPTTSAPTPRRRRHRWLVLALTLALVAAACGDDDPEGTAPPPTEESPTASTAATTESSAPATTAADDPPTSDGDAVTAALHQVFQTEITAGEVDPLIVEALERATQELTPEQLDVAFTCWEGSDCEIPGGGDVTLAITDGFGGNTWRRISKMEAILQALTYPEVGRIISTDANFDLATMQSQVRGASAQGADVIVAYDDFGDAMAPTFGDVQGEGAFVSTYVGPVPSAGPDQVVTQVVTDTCAAGTNMADAVAEMLGGSGSIAFFNGTPGNPQGAAWNGCAEDRLAEVAPDVEVVFSADTDWTPSGAFEAASALIATGEDVDAILYDYADPLPQVVDAYAQAGETPPALVTWTMNNELFRVWEEAQGTDAEFELFYTNGLNWVARVSVTAAMNAYLGEPEAAEVIYPLPFVPAEEGFYQPDRPGDFPGSALVPDELLDRMIS